MTTADATDFIYGHMLRPLGIGALIGGAVMGVVMTFPAMKAAINSLAKAASTAGTDAGGAGSDEMPLWVIIVGTITSMIMFFIASMLIPEVSLLQGLIVAVVGTAWLCLAALIVAQATGMTDLSPMSGMALISVTIMMFLLGNNVAAAMVVGVAVCIAIGQSADMMQDFKTGFLIGARPIKQQLAQFGVTWIGAVVAILSIYVLWLGGSEGSGGFGPGTDLPAPQAGVLTGIIEGLMSGNIPFEKYVMGGTIGAILASAPYPGLGVMVGLAMYLPFPITAVYGIGCLCQIAIQRIKGALFCDHKLVPLAAGLIIGEAIIGVGHAFLEIIRTYVL